MSRSRRRPGRMGPHVAGFEAWLLERGYTPGTVRGELKVVGRLGLWMAAEDVDVADLTSGVIEALDKLVLEVSADYGRWANQSRNVRR